MAYRGSGEVLGYDGSLFRAGQDAVRTARLELDVFNFNPSWLYESALKTFAESIRAIRQVCEDFHHGIDLVRLGRDQLTLSVSYNGLFTLNDDPLVQLQLHRLLLGAQEGVVKASQSIHSPATDYEQIRAMLDERKVLGSPSDFKTDTEAYETLERFMDPNFHLGTARELVINS